jgi:TDG/mug DNA glycosylase family protein
VPALRPTKAELATAGGRTVPDLVGPGLRVLFVGINPGLYSGATGRHFAKPGNRFWPTIHLAGFTDRQLSPMTDEAELLAAGYGITALVRRATATAAELTPEELRVGAKAVVGRQAEPLGESPLWVLPNPSGLNAHYQLPALVELFGELRRSLDPPAPYGAVSPG